MKRLASLLLLVYAVPTLAAHSGPRPVRPLAERAATLKPGQYVWQDEADRAGSVSIVINLSSQRALLYRDGMLVAVSTISTGSEGRETPTGTFTILQKEIVHRSRTYDDAPMPFMQRLTWKGVSMHAGNLPGYPASHGCIRLPARFAKLLFAVTTIGTPVTIRDDADTDIVEGTDQGSPAEPASSEAQRR